MKKAIAIVLAAMTATGAYAQKSSLNNNTKSEYISFFTNSINGVSDNIKKENRLSLKEIDNARSEVWECWRTAVNAIDEEKLPASAPANTRDTLLWHIPTHPEADAVMPFHYLHKGDKPADGYPLFLYMHGSGPKDAEWNTGYHICREFADGPSIYFIPQIPSENHYRWAIQPQQLAWEKLLRLAFVSDEINPDRIYFFGISEGGYGSQRLASYYADYLAGAGPMAGGEPLQNAPCENLANTAFSLRTGERDYGFGRNYLTYVTATTLDSLQAAHPGLYTHNVKIMPKMGHGINYEETTPWLAQYKRNTRPTYLYWENYDMYGRKRQGFGYLRADEEHCAEGERTCYEMNIEGNTITLDVKKVTYETVQKLGTIPMTFKKTYTPATEGKVTIFLSEDLIDFKKPVKIIVNGKEQINKKIKPSARAMAQSCALFYDPRRIFPASVQVTVE